MSPLRAALIAAAATLLVPAPAKAGGPAPIPLASGRYCAPGGDRIEVDAARDEVRIDGFVCAFPLVGADRLQSDLCRDATGGVSHRLFDLRVIGRQFIHGGAWYRPCAGG